MPFSAVARMLMLFSLLLCSVARVLCAQPASPPNLLENGRFAHMVDGEPVGWGLGPNVVRGIFQPGKFPCLKIDSSIPQYATAVQYLSIDGRRVTKVRFSGRVCYRNVVRGAHDYDVLRAFIIWHGANGSAVGEYADAGMWTGSSGWKTFDALCDVPLAARRAELIVGLHECAGVCWFTDLALMVAQGDVSFIPGQDANTEVAGWWPFNPTETPARGAVIDLSALADTPAGKHGFVVARDGHLFFQDGARARFWGFDIMGGECFPTHATAVRLADRLCRMGVNIVRLHHLDAWWAEPNIFDPHKNDTQHLSATSLDRLDYFMAQLKKRGIYVYWDWLVNRKFKPGDKVPDANSFMDGAKIVAHFDLRIIALEKQYMAQLLRHKNPYTGIRLADEPQIAMSEVINEDSLFYEDWYDYVPTRYLKELTVLCHRYEPEANPLKHPFDKPTLHALYRIESAYFTDMRAYLRKQGLRCPTTGSNHWENIGPALLCDAQTDYIDRHYYWDHPKVDFGYTQAFDNMPMLSDYSDGLVPALAGAKVAGKPMVVTEWCCCWINDYIAEGPLVGAAYACQQDWDAMIWFDISSAAPGSAMENEFDIANKPHLYAQWAAATLLFRRQDLPPATAVRRFQITREALLAGKPLTNVDDLGMAQQQRVETGITDSLTDDAPAMVADASINTPLQWDETAARLTLTTPKTVALDGFLADDKPYDLGWAQVHITGDFCALWFTSLDGQPLAESKHLLITVAARAENRGQRFNRSRTSLVKPGKSPIVIQPVKATIDFPTPVIIHPLDANGNPAGTLTANHLSLDQHRTFWYEVRR